jgi:hypothetical protein
VALLIAVNKAIQAAMVVPSFPPESEARLEVMVKLTTDLTRRDVTNAWRPTIKNNLWSRGISRLISSGSSVEALGLSLPLSVLGGLLVCPTRIIGVGLKLSYVLDRDCSLSWGRWNLEDRATLSTSLEDV